MLFCLQIVYGVQSKPARWKKCVDYTNGFMGMAVGRLFVAKHFPEEAKSMVTSLNSSVTLFIC